MKTKNKTTNEDHRLKTNSTLFSPRIALKNQCLKVYAILRIAKTVLIFGKNTTKIMCTSSYILMHKKTTKRKFPTIF